MSDDQFHEKSFSMGSHDEVYLDGDHIPFAEGDSQRVLNLALSVGDEMLTVVLDEYHLAELRKALARGEKWVKKK